MKDNDSRRCQLLLLSAKMDALLLEAKLEEDRFKVNQILTKLHNVIKEYDALLKEIYGYSS